MIKYYKDILQRSPEWYALRCGLLTSSDIKKIITPAKLQFADNQTCRDHMADLATQRIMNYVEPQFSSFEMLRGYDDELDAKRYYIENYGEIEDCGFVTNDELGDFTLGYSPDGLIGDDGIIEVKGKLPKLQLGAVLNAVRLDVMPEEYMVQVQTGLLVTNRQYCDFILYSNGFNMFVIRVERQNSMQESIIKAADEFHTRLRDMMQDYAALLMDDRVRLIPVERRAVEIGAS